jgi:hypothetical protein
MLDVFPFTFANSTAVASTGRQRRVNLRAKKGASPAPFFAAS